MTIDNSIDAAMQNTEKLMKIITDAQTTGLGMAEKLVKINTLAKLNISDLEYMGKNVDLYA